MIRKLTSADHDQLLSFLMDERSFNLFIIGDIESFDYDQEFQEIWGEFDEFSELRAVMLRYYDSFIPYTKSTINAPKFASIIKSYQRIFPTFTLSGKTEVVEQFERVDGLDLGKKTVMFFCECTTSKHISHENMCEVKKATVEDVDRITDLRKRIPEFTTTSATRDMISKQLETNTGRTYYIEENGMVVSSVSATAENSYSVMVVGVCTDERFRKKGYASAIMQTLIKEYTDEGKTLCLCYHNPEAGSIYKRLGFKDIGTWTMYRY